MDLRLPILFATLPSLLAEEGAASQAVFDEIYYTHQSATQLYDACLEEHSRRQDGLSLYDGFGAWSGEGRGLLAEGAVTPQAIFDEIYGQNLWSWKGGIGSGIGSSFESVGRVWCALERVVSSFGNIRECLC